MDVSMQIKKTALRTALGYIEKSRGKCAQTDGLGG